MYNPSPGRSDDDLHEAVGRLEHEFQRSDPPEHAATTPPQQPVRTAVPQQASRPRAWVVPALLAINVIMYGATVALSQVVGGQNPFGTALYLLGAKHNISIDAGEWWRLLTPTVLHGSLMHLLFNSYALYVLGTDVEYAFGVRRFLAIYVLAGLGGSMASYVFNPQSLSVGASGAIFGLLGALAARIFAARSVLSREAVKMQFGQIGSLLALNLFFGFTVPNIDNAAHIGGLIVGALVGLLLAPRYEVVQVYGASRVQRRETGQLVWLLVIAVGVALVGGFIAIRSVV